MRRFVSFARLLTPLMALLMLVGVVSAQSSSFDLSTSRLIFSDVKGGAPSATQPLTITNTTGATISIDSLNFSGSGTFSLVGAPGTPFNIGANSSQVLNVQFAPNAEGVFVATLSVGGTGGTETVELRGLGTDGEGNMAEPSLQYILDTWDLGISTGDDDPATTPIHGSNGGTAGPLGDEVLIPAFRRANTGQPVTVELLAAYAVDHDPIVRVGWYASGDTSTRQVEFMLNEGDDQQLTPTASGSLSFVPGADVFGFWTFWPPSFFDYSVYQEDHLNVFETNDNERHKVRFFPVPGEANAYVMAVEEYTTGFDYNDIVMIVRNVTPNTGAGVITFENRDWTALRDLHLDGTQHFDRWLTFSGLRNKIQQNATSHGMHREVTLRVRNEGNEALTVNSMSISNTAHYRLPDGYAGFSLNPGEFKDILVELISTTGSKGTLNETLTLNSTAKNEPVAVIQLASVYMTAPEGSNELYIDEMMPAFGFYNNIGNVGSGAGNPAGRWEVGADSEEILSYKWQRQNGGKSIYVRQLAAYHGCCDGGQASFRLDFDSGNDPSFTHDKLYGQSVQPLKNNSSAFSEYNQNRSEQFRIIAHNNWTACNGDCGNSHAVRVWPLRDAGGHLIQDVYIIGHDYTGASYTNYDYNDNMYLMANVKPVSGTQPTQPDLTVNGSDSSDPIKAGLGFTYTFDARNMTTVQADDVTLTINLPNEVVVNSLDIPGTCTGTNIITCALGSSFVHTETLTVDVTTTTAGTYIATASISSSSESDGSNNSIQVKTTVASQGTPVAQADSYSTTEGEALYITSVDEGVLGNDSDADGDDLTAVLVKDADHGTLNLQATGLFSYIPDTDFADTDTFTYYATDGIANSATVTVTIEVENINDDPVVNNDAYSTDEDVVLEVIPQAGVLANDEDIDQDQLTAILVEDVTEGTLTLDANGGFSYTPPQDFSGEAFFTYKVDDGTVMSGTALVTITVNAVNDAPIANNDSYSLLVNGTLTVDAANGVKANDSDVETDTAALTVTLSSSVSHGSLSFNADGSFTYTPNADYIGADSFTYTLSDGELSDTAAVSISVSPDNEVPTAAPDGYNVVAGDTLNATAAIGVLANDSDPDGDVLTAVLVDNVATGSLSFNADGSFVYMAPADADGTVTFTYKANDGTADSSTAVVTLSISQPVDLIANGGFESYQQRDAKDWDMKGRELNGNRVKCNKTDRPNGKPDKIFAYEGECTYQFKGRAGKKSRLIQKVDFSGVQAGDVLSFSAMVEAKNLDNNKARVMVKAKYIDGSKNNVKVSIPNGSYAYTLQEGTLPVNGTLDKLKVIIFYNNERGRMRVDAAQLRVNVPGTQPGPIGFLPVPAEPSVLPLPPAVQP